MDEFVIVGIPGSFRRGAYSRALLAAAVELVPAGARIDVAELGTLPVYNQDDDASLPPSVARLKGQVRAAGAILFALNEHNFGLSAAEKNVLDWVSRPAGDNSWSGKAAGILSSSVGILGGARAQYALRQSMVSLNMFPINKPEVIVPFVQQKLDAGGRLTDETTRKFIGDHLRELVRHGRQLALRPEPRATYEGVKEPEPSARALGT
jgi:chromate reductase, NAD(P)H dehydrogenase (quinone)